MQCTYAMFMSYWFSLFIGPEYNDEFHCELPVYRGFEVDVLRAVWEYYSSSKDSLVCSNLYELFLAVQSIVRSGKSDTAIDALQLCMLLLPRANKIKLQKLLRFMSKVASNQQLLLTDLMNNRQVVSGRLGWRWNIIVPSTYLII